MTSTRLLLAALAGGLLVAGPVLESAHPRDGGEPVRPSAAAPITAPTMPRQSRAVVFEPNLGQWSPDVAFQARGQGAVAQIGATHARLMTPDGDRQTALTLRVGGASGAAVAEPFDRQPAFSAYLLGRDPTRWQTHVPRYGGVRYRQVYPGIDLVYHSRDQRLEYDFVVQPGADPARIAVAFDGATAIALDGDGDLLVTTAAGQVRQRRPEVYQELDGRRVAVDARQVLTGGTIAFVVADYDHSRPLVVDPVIEWATLFGGSVPSTTSPAEDHLDAVVAGPDGSIYVAGWSSASDYALLHPIDSTPVELEAVISKFTPDPVTGVPALAWSTYVGGSDGEVLFDITVAADGDIYVVGDTDSPDFPILHSFQTTTPASNNLEAFAMRLDDAGSSVSVVWSTLLGGTGSEFGKAIAVDPSGRIYVGGETWSTNFPTLLPFQGNQPGTDMFITRFNPFSGGNLTLNYSTYLGGNGGTEELTGLAVDGTSVYVAGRSDSTTFPQSQGLVAPRGGPQGFVTRLSTGHTPPLTMNWFTFLGDRIDDVVVRGGAVYVAGTTTVPDIPMVHAYQTQAHRADVFLARIDQTSPISLGWSSLFGGESDDTAAAIAVDRSGAVYVGGTSMSYDLPLYNAPAQPMAPAQRDAFMARFIVDTYGELQLVGSAVVGGSSGELLTDLALDPEARVYLTGISGSLDFPFVNPVDTTQGGLDGFLARLRNDPVGVSLQSTPSGVGFTVTGPQGCQPGGYTTPRMQLLTPVPSSACVVDFPSTTAAVAGSRQRFSGWSDPYLPAAPRLTFDVPDFPVDPLFFTARYVTQHQLTTRVAPVGAGTITPASGVFFDAGAVVPVAATAAACVAFRGWSANVASGQVTMSAPQTVTATFIPDTAATLTNVSITRGPMQLVAPGRYRQVVTVRNNGAAVSNPRLVVQGLTAGFSVVNAEGTTSCVAPAGRPYRSIPAPFGTQNVTLEFFRLGAVAAPAYATAVVANGQP